MRFVQIALAALMITSFNLPLLAYDFPGQGSASDWSDALPYYNLGNRYLNQQRYSDAASKYQEAINRYPYDPDFYINLGVALRKMDDYGEAEQAFKKAIELNDKDWSAWSDLGNACLKQNRLKETISAFERALKCNPPPKDRAALLGDICDIHKVLKNLGQEPLSTNTSSAGVKSVKKPNPKRKAGVHPASAQHGGLTAPHAVPSTPGVPGAPAKDWGYQ